MEQEACLTQPEMISLIYSTLSDSITELSSDIDRIKLLHPDEMPEQDLVSLVDQTRKLVVFLKYSSEYMRKTFIQASVREEILRIKLHLLSVLRALSERVKASDRVAVHDLITEELRDNLVLWKINVLPLLRPPRTVSTFGSIHP